ncbi:T9SS type A sorting domain-containing protein [Fulvivirga sp.]|uniref:T9SS type A sorting domain-containing protein n=1 Tax=Fulvivirga sp. TaxID=1931237 RepID=UPI0032EB9A62
MKKFTFKLVIGAMLSAALITTVLFNFDKTDSERLIAKAKSSKPKKSIVVNGLRYDGPEKFAYYQSAIRAGQEDLDAPRRYPQYKPFHKLEALESARKSRFKARTESTATFIERGPANVPGRTRSIIVDPDDATQQTWFAANVSGGIWKTTNGGTSWTEIAPDLENMAVVTLAMSEANTSVIYAGTGEGFVYNGTFILNGEGIYKSSDKGVTWSLLPSTTTAEFTNVSRIIVDPADENILLASTSGHKVLGGGTEEFGAVMRSIDGGTSWTKVFEIGAPVQQIIAAPSNFDIQYLAVAQAAGVYKTLDGGITWAKKSNGLLPGGRIELGVSYSNPDRVYASAEGSVSGSGSDLYTTNNGGDSWGLVDIKFDGEAPEFLGTQGWYDNTILVHPFDDTKVYFGGISAFQAQLNPTNDVTSSAYAINIDEVGSFLNLINFSAENAGGVLEVGSSANEITVEIRFGAGKSQKAHRFLVPQGQGSGVPDANYSYADYVNVPFEVWDVANDRQLMVSFRDQQRNGTFELNASNTEGDASTHSREYLYISDVDYNAITPDDNIAQTGGHVHNSMYFIWPVLTDGGSWTPGSFEDSKLVISFEEVNVFGGDLTVVADSYNEFGGKNTNVHPDQHWLTPIITDEGAETFKILLGNDGGVYISNDGTDPGTESNNWTAVGNTYNTTQFYGADKIAGVERYAGGAQDNGTWWSIAGENASKTSNFQFLIGGDGFEVVAHYTDPLKFIGGSQFNGFVGTDDGGESFYNATNGLSEDGGPFVSRLSTAYQDPDVLFAVENTGVFKSTDFGRNWKEIPISEKWGFWSGSDVEVSKADPRIVWAGGRMTENGSLHVSTDGGESFEPVPNFMNLGLCTGIYSHPTKDSTAFAVFSVANSPKVIRTDDLGETWADISGYSFGSSSTGFPDVAVFALQAMPYDEDVLWAGTEIGLFESTDAGQTWNIVDEFPSVTIWDFKIKDGQVVIATHGRGIWTADIPELADFKAPEVPLAPVIASIGKSLTELAIELTIDLRSAYDSTQVFANDFYAGSLPENNLPESIEASLSVSAAGNYEIQAISYVNGVPYYSSTSAIDVSENLEPITSYYSDFEDPNNDADFIRDRFTISVAPGSGATRALNTDHPYPTAESLGVNEVNLTAQLAKPIIVAEGDAFIRFDEIVLVEEGEAGTVFGDQQFWDYVIVEGSLDGNNWIPLLDGYDSDANEAWDGTSTSATVSLYRPREIDIKSTFDAGDIIQLRFRLFSDFGANAWGWGIDNLRIQFDDDNIPTGIAEEADSDVIIYPVPANEQLTVGVNNTFKGATIIQIIDLNGKVKWAKSVEMNNQTAEFSIDVSAFAQGIYLVKIKDSTSSLVRRISIQ